MDPEKQLQEHQQPVVAAVQLDRVANNIALANGGYPASPAAASSEQ